MGPGDKRTGLVGPGPLSFHFCRRHGVSDDFHKFARLGFGLMEQYG